MPLFVVSTPIGNLQDITLRALTVLKEAHIILCENTKDTNFLLEKHGISSKKLISFTDHTKDHIFLPFLEDALNKNIILVSDAGTPLISDPGYLLLKEAKARGVTVIPIPGACSVTTALSVCSLPISKFAFLGFFLPELLEVARNLLEKEVTVAFFIPGRDILKVLSLMLKVLPGRNVSILRELTKVFEDIKTSSIEEMISYYTDKKKLKGEAVFVVSGKGAILTLSDIQKKLLETLQKKPFLKEIGVKHLSEIIKAYESDFGNVSRKEIYNALLKIK